MVSPKPEVRLPRAIGRIGHKLKMPQRTLGIQSLGRTRLLVMLRYGQHTCQSLAMRRK